MMRRWFSILLAVVLFQALAAAQTKLTPIQFTEDCAAAFRAAAPDVRVEIAGHLHLKIVYRDGRWSTPYLDNLYANYLRDPDGKERIVAHYVRETLKASAEVNEPPDRDRIVPVLRARAGLNVMRGDTPGTAPGSGVLFEWLAADIAIIYVEDRPGTLRFLPPREFAKIGVRQPELRALAIANLRRTLPKIEFELEDGVYSISAGGIFESSLVLLPEVWTAQNFPVKGDIIVAIPTRDRLLVAGSDDVAALARMRETAEEEFEAGPYSVSPKLYRYRTGALVELAR